MLKITMEFRKGILFIRLKGKFTQKEDLKFKREVVDKIKIYGIRSVVFNIQDLKEIDLKGMHSILYIYELCKENRGKVLVCELYDSPAFEKLKKNRIFQYVEIIKSELDAFEIIKI
jgi:anti-anti-sigma factor